MSSESSPDPIFAMIDLVDELVEGDRDNAIRVLNEEIDRVQFRFTVLSALRDSLLPESAEETELPLAEPDAGRSAVDGDLETQIIQYVSKHGGSMPSDIARAIGVHHTKIGRAVKRIERAGQGRQTGRIEAELVMATALTAVRSSTSIATSQPTRLVASWSNRDTSTPIR